jgi:eukaryotic-like serine/threonine-protein kinase
MANSPPRPAAPRPAGSASSGGTSQSSSGTRSKDADKQPGTFFLGRYRVVDEIGVGGMASVHLARMDGPGGFQKWVAIKRIHPHLVEDDQFVDMFLDEARIAAGINHANVAQVFDLGKDDNTYWIAMEYLHGEPLREVMRRAEERGLRLSPELASRICSDAAEGLHAAHELRGKNNQLLGLVHRDVTPHNLFLTYDGYTKVVDFGIAKVADRLSSTRAGTLKGKLAYMSPEQVRGVEVDRTTDIFALGVVLWELTTNQRLFRMDTDLDTLEKVQACVVPAPSSLVVNYPMELESVVMKALAKRKQDRFQTAREFSRALQNFLMRAGSFVGPEEVAAFVRQVFSDRIQKREAHLAWAAEVTSTINVDQLQGKPVLTTSPEESAPGVEDEGEDRRSNSQVSGMAAPTNGARPMSAPPAPTPLGGQMAAMSLMDDDEDVPTTVAMMREIENARGPAVPPRPAAGAPSGSAAQGFPQNGGPQARPGFGQNQPGYAQPPPFGAAGAQPNYGMPARPYGPANAVADERTASLPGGGDDLGATVALPVNAKQLEQERQRASGGQPYAPFGQPQGGAQGGFTPPPGPGFNGQNFGPQYGSFSPQGGAQAAQQSFSSSPATSSQSSQQGLQMPPGGPQSQIETALSLPRPDPATLWLAQQEKQRGERRNTGVLIAVVALTALCVIGIGALVYFKVKSGTLQLPKPETPSAPVTASPSSALPSPATPDFTETAVISPASASAAPSARAAAPAVTAAGPGTNATVPAVSTMKATSALIKEAKDTKEAKETKDDSGYLTIVCNPYCDDVLDQGKSLGPSPVVHISVKPGQHRITLKKGGQTKVISVIVEAGQVAAQRVTMTK